MTSTPKGVTQQMSPSPTSNNVYQVNPAIGIGQQYNMTLYDVLNYGLPNLGRVKASMA